MKPIHNLLATLALLFSIACVTTSCDGKRAQAETQPAKPATVNITVTGMTCAGCSTAIKETLEPMPGVQAIAVDHETGKATVTTNGNDALPAKLVSTIKELGFQATLQ